MTPRPLPASDGHPWSHVADSIHRAWSVHWPSGYGYPHPEDEPDLFWPTVALIGAATTVAYLTARTLLRRLP